MRKPVMALVGLALTSAGLMTGLPAEAATPAKASISATPTTVPASFGTAHVKVTYRCTNDSKITYYLVGSITQDIATASDAKSTVTLFTYGKRTLKRAQCTGKSVTQTLEFKNYGEGATFRGLAADLHLTLSPSRGASASRHVTFKLV